MTPLLSTNDQSNQMSSVPSTQTDLLHDDAHACIRAIAKLVRSDITDMLARIAPSNDMLTVPNDAPGPLVVGSRKRSASAGNFKRSRRIVDTYDGLPFDLKRLADPCIAMYAREGTYTGPEISTLPPSKRQRYMHVYVQSSSKRSYKNAFDGFKAQKKVGDKMFSIAYGNDVKIMALCAFAFSEDAKLREWGELQEWLERIKAQPKEFETWLAGIGK